VTGSDLAINRELCPFGVLMSLYLTKLRTRHLHGTCASRIRRVKRPPCACLELRWTGRISDGKEDQDTEGEEEEDDDDDGLRLGMGIMGWTREWDDGKSRCGVLDIVLSCPWSRRLEDTLGPGDDDCGGFFLVPSVVRSASVTVRRFGRCQCQCQFQY
jgi:hypothetical protein